MSVQLPVRVVGTAARAIIEAAEWWASNRPKAPEAFAEELEGAPQLLAAQPEIGARAQNTRLNGVRRIHLTRIRYYLYYRVSESPPAIEVLALWHASRGSVPQI